MFSDRIGLSFREEVKKIAVSANSLSCAPKDIIFDIISGDMKNCTELNIEDLKRLYHQTEYYFETDCNEYVGSFYKTKNLSHEMFKVVFNIIVKAKSGDMPVKRCYMSDCDPKKLHVLLNELAQRLQKKEGFTDIKITAIDSDMYDNYVFFYDEEKEDKYDSFCVTLKDTVEKAFNEGDFENAQKLLDAFNNIRKQKGCE